MAEPGCVQPDSAAAAAARSTGHGSGCRVASLARRSATGIGALMAGAAAVWSGAVTSSAAWPAGALRAVEHRSRRLHPPRPVGRRGPAIVDHQQHRTAARQRAAGVQHRSRQRDDHQPGGQHPQRHQPPWRACGGFLVRAEFGQQADGREALAARRRRSDPQQPPEHRQRQQAPAAARVRQRSPRGQRRDRATAMRPPAGDRCGGSRSRSRRRARLRPDRPAGRPDVRRRRCARSRRVGSAHQPRAPSRETALCPRRATPLPPDPAPGPNDHWWGLPQACQPPSEFRAAATGSRRSARRWRGAAATRRTARQHRRPARVPSVSARRSRPLRPEIGRRLPSISATRSPPRSSSEASASSSSPARSRLSTLATTANANACWPRHRATGRRSVRLPIRSRGRTSHAAPAGPTWRIAASRCGRWNCL